MLTAPEICNIYAKFCNKRDPCTCMQKDHISTYICWHCWWQDNFWHSTSMGRNGESTNYSQRSNVKKQLTIVILSLVQITKKANCTLGFLHWNLRHCPTVCKQNTYLALIHCWNTEPSSWTPYQGSDKMEQLQQSTACFKARDYRFNTPLHERHEQLCLTFIHMCTRQSRRSCQQCQQIYIYQNLDNSWLSRTKDVRWGNTFCV